MIKGSAADWVSLREGFGAGLLQAARQHGHVVALSADLSHSVQMGEFRKTYPHRFFQVGVAEANMIGIAAGMAASGLCPFTGTFANFSTGRVYDQIRQSVAYSNKNVKLSASHMGVSLGEDGATHQMLEDIGMMRMLPNMVVLTPCDYHQTIAAVMASAAYKGPVYLRFGRPKWPVFTPKDALFSIGKATRLTQGNDVSIVAHGHMVWIALQATKVLKAEGISCELVNLSTIKPLDEATLLSSAKKTGCVVTAEEHQRYGGIGDMLAQLFARHFPVPMECVAVEDKFGKSGRPLALLNAYGLNEEAIVHAVRRVKERKDALG